MKTSSIALAMLALLAAGCSASEEAPAAPEASTTAASVDEVAPTQASTATPEETEAASNRTTVSGTVDSLVLETDPPIVMLTGADGKKYIGNVSPAAAASVTAAIEGVDSLATLDCEPAIAPAGAEPGYTWLDDCKLAD